MATILPLSQDLKEIIISVTGQKPQWIFNDKRVSFVRRYKYTGVKNVSKKKLRKINKKISKKYPEYQFVVQNGKNTIPYMSWSNGLTVKVFD